MINSAASIGDSELGQLHRFVGFLRPLHLGRSELFHFKNGRLPTEAALILQRFRQHGGE
jgi:hypothetical protein